MTSARRSARSAGFHRPSAAGSATLSAGSGGVVRIGFVPLIDAAPLVAAQELGLFRQQGVRVALEKQIGWANVRDKLAYGHLDAGHALIGMPLSSTLGTGWAGEPLVSIMELGSGGNAITLSRALAERGVRSAATFARWIGDRKGAARSADDRKPVLAHVFGCSMHHYLLREWLSAAGIDPDLDVSLRVIPPAQMVEHMRHGHLDGFCVGEPWNTLAERGGDGVVVIPTTDIVPDHPEKVLAVTRRWAAQNPIAAVALVKALVEACRWCADEANLPALSELLAGSAYINLPADVIAASLRLNRTLGMGVRPAASRPPTWRMRSFAVDRTFPHATHAAWLAEQAIRWGHASPDVDVVAAALKCTEPRFYRQAAGDLGIACPADDLAPMPLRHGHSYDPRRSPYCGPRDPVPESELLSSSAGL
jgi:nitrate/nitrite transport system substrate-binding protein